MSVEEFFSLLGFRKRTLLEGHDLFGREGSATVQQQAVVFFEQRTQIRTSRWHQSTRPGKVRIIYLRLEEVNACVDYLTSTSRKCYTYKVDVFFVETSNLIVSFWLLPLWKYFISSYLSFLATSFQTWRHYTERILGNMSLFGGFHGFDHYTCLLSIITDSDIAESRD
jgi:hypothetical protein